MNAGKHSEHHEHKSKKIEEVEKPENKTIEKSAQILNKIMHHKAPVSKEQKNITDENIDSKHLGQVLKSVNAEHTSKVESWKAPVLPVEPVAAAEAQTMDSKQLSKTLHQISHTDDNSDQQVISAANADIDNLQSSLKTA